MLSRVRFLIVLVALLLLPLGCAHAGPPVPYGARYPDLMLIASHGGSVWFAGSWSSRFIVVERDNADRWHTHVCPGAYSRLQTVTQTADSLLFFSYSLTMAFDLERRRWGPYKESVESESSDEELSGPTHTLTFSKGDSLLSFSFPLPSFNAYQRWRFHPEASMELQANIGDTIQMREGVWFTINFYAGEGSTGIGGLGVFDEHSRTFGVLRNDRLSASSANQLVRKGDTIFVATGLDTESGLIESSGLVVIDTYAGRIANAFRDNSPLLGGTFSKIKLVDDCLWMITDEAIVGWDLAHDQWCAVRMDSVVTNARTAFSRRIRILQNPNDWGNVARDTLIPALTRTKGSRYDVMWLDDSKVECQIEPGVTGWVSTEELKVRRTYSQDALADMPGMSVFADSGLLIPYHYVKFGALVDGSSSKGATQVRVGSLWCDASSLDPVFSVLWQNRAKALQWQEVGGSYAALLSGMCNEFRREQKEILDRVPVCDTTFVIRKGMDLYKQFNDLVDVRWTPDGDDKDKAPKGLIFRIDPFESETSLEVLCNHGQITVNGTAYESTKDFVIETPKLRAVLRFADLRCSGVAGNVLETITVTLRLVLIPVRSE